MLAARFHTRLNECVGVFTPFGEEMIAAALADKDTRQELDQLISDLASLLEVIVNESEPEPPRVSIR